MHVCMCILGSEVAYGDIMKMVGSTSVPGGVKYSEDLQSPFFDITINGSSHQVSTREVFFFCYVCMLL